MASRPRLDPAIRVMLEGRYKRGGTRQWCVAVGTPKPKRSCLWLAIAFFESTNSAVRYYNRLDPEKGRAMFDLDNPRLRFISPEGKTLRCLEIEERLLS